MAALGGTMVRSPGWSGMPCDSVCSTSTSLSRVKFSGFASRSARIAASSARTDAVQHKTRLPATSRPPPTFASARHQAVQLIEPALESDFLAALEDQRRAAAAVVAASLTALDEVDSRAAASRQTSSTNSTTSISAISQAQDTSGGGFLGLFSAAFGRRGQAQSSFGPPSSSSKPKPLAVVAMFTAEWCGPCSLVHKELVRVPSLFSDPSLDLRLLVLDVEDNPALATRLRVKSLPTLFFLGPDPSKPPIATTGVVSDKQVCDIVRSKVLLYAGCNLKGKPLAF